jgi:hypothetical protein
MKPTQSYTYSATSTLGRWHNVDPMAETYHTQSPYHFSGNNPVFFIEQNGMFYTPPVDGRAQEDGNMTGGERDFNDGKLPPAQDNIRPLNPMVELEPIVVTPNSDAANSDAPAKWTDRVIDGFTRIADRLESIFSDGYDAIKDMIEAFSSPNAEPTDHFVTPRPKKGAPEKESGEKTQIQTKSDKEVLREIPNPDAQTQFKNPQQNVPDSIDIPVYEIDGPSRYRYPLNPDGSTDDKNRRQIPF